MKTLSPVRFFFVHAGFSYQPDKETKQQGRWRCARQLAEAEAFARDTGLAFIWDKDGMTSAEWTDEKPAWETWGCVAKDETGKTVASLCGIDFGRDGEPWGKPYKRVVEAELALEVKGQA